MEFLKGVKWLVVQSYDQDDATGFIRLNGLSLKVAAKVHGKKKQPTGQK